MASNKLVFTKGEVLPDTTHAHQTGDGTLFYSRFFVSPNTLYVIHEGKQLEVALPKDNYYFGAFGNDLYFNENDTWKLYKLSFNRQDATFTITFLRDQLPNEQVHGGAICSRKKDGKTVAYRMCDDPEQDGIDIDIPKETLENICGIHRGKVLFIAKNNDLAHPVARKLGENAVLVELSNPRLRCVTPESSRFAYFSNCENLFALDVQTLEFLPPLSYGIEMSCVGGIHDGVLSVHSQTEGGSYLATARLPEEYL